MAAASTGSEAVDPAVLNAIASALQSLQYGQVQVTVHDARVTEICTTVRKSSRRVC